MGHAQVSEGRLPSSQMPDRRPPVSAQREALTRGPHHGRRDHAEPLARQPREVVPGGFAACVAALWWPGLPSPRWHSSRVRSSSAAAGRDGGGAQGLRKTLLFSVSVPRGPLGWVGARVMPLGHGPVYPLVAGVLDLQARRRPAGGRLRIPRCSWRSTRRTWARSRAWTSRTSKWALLDGDSVIVSPPGRRRSSRVMPWRCLGRMVGSAPSPAWAAWTSSRAAEGAERDASGPSPRRARRAHDWLKVDDAKVSVRDPTP